MTTTAIPPFNHYELSSDSFFLTLRPWTRGGPSPLLLSMALSQTSQLTRYQIKWHCTVSTMLPDISSNSYIVRYCFDRTAWLNWFPEVNPQTKRPGHHNTEHFNHLCRMLVYLSSFWIEQPPCRHVYFTLLHSWISWHKKINPDTDNKLQFPPEPLPLSNSDTQQSVTKNDYG